MKKIYQIFILILFLIITFALQIYLFNSIKFFEVYANILLVLVITISIWQKPLTANIFAGIIGLVSDLLFTNGIGKFLIIYLIVSVLVQVLIKFYRKETFASYIYVAAISTITYEIYMMIVSLITNSYFNIGQLIIVILEELVINIALTFLVGSIIKRISE